MYPLMSISRQKWCIHKMLSFFSNIKLRIVFTITTIYYKNSLRSKWLSCWFVLRSIKCSTAALCVYSYQMAHHWHIVQHILKIVLIYHASYVSCKATAVYINRSHTRSFLDMFYHWFLTYVLHLCSERMYSKLSVWYSISVQYWGCYFIYFFYFQKIR
jgi:hypothetical protein